MKSVFSLIISLTLGVFFSSIMLYGCSSSLEEASRSKSTHTAIHKSLIKIHQPKSSVTNSYPRFPNPAVRPSNLENQ